MTKWWSGALKINEILKHQMSTKAEYYSNFITMAFHIHGCKFSLLLTHLHCLTSSQHDKKMETKLERSWHVSKLAQTSLSRENPAFFSPSLTYLPSFVTAAVFIALQSLRLTPLLFLALSICDFAVKAFCCEGVCGGFWSISWIYSGKSKAFFTGLSLLSTNVCP